MIIKQFKQAGGQKNSEQARRLLEEARANPNAADLLDVRVYSTAVDAFANCGKCQEATDIINLMWKESFRPNHITNNPTIEACGNSGQWQVSLDLVRHT